MELKNYAASNPRVNYFTYKYKVFEITDDFRTLKATLPDEETHELCLREFSLVEVKPAVLAVLRVMVKTPFVIIKKGEKYYVTVEEVPFKCTFSGSTFCGLNHRCSSGPAKTGTCPRLLALPDEMGGCQKVLDCNAAMIEKYPWIEFAAECVNTHYPSFMVLECEHHPRPRFQEI